MSLLMHACRIPAVALCLVSLSAGEACYLAIDCVIPDDTPTMEISWKVPGSGGTTSTVTKNCVCKPFGSAKGAEAKEGYYASGQGCGIYKYWDAGDKKHKVANPTAPTFCGPEGLLAIACPGDP